MTRLARFSFVMLLAVSTAAFGCSSDDESNDTSTGTDDTGDGDGDTEPEPRPDFFPINIDQTGRHFLDEDGRTMFLRGVNARVEGVFDVVFDDGRERIEPLPDMPASDCVRMREMGFNLIRLPVNWSALEPEMDVFDDTYFDNIDGVLQCAADAGIYVLIDFHYDAYSKHIGEDGAPLWAIVPAPTEDQLVEGPITEQKLAEWRTSIPVLLAYESFFTENDDHNLQAQFIDAVGYMAARYKDNDTVIGIEIFNEPYGDPRIVHPFNKRAAARIAEEAPEKLAVFNPSVLRGFRNNYQEPPIDPPFGEYNGVYAPHQYNNLFGAEFGNLEALTAEMIDEGNQPALDETLEWQAPLLISEFGVGPQLPGHDNYLKLQMDSFDKMQASSVFWLWKEMSQGFWGLHDIEEDGSWTERPAMIALVSRVYVPHVAGTPVDIVPGDNVFTVTYDAALEGLSNQVYVPERLVVDSITCNGTAVELSANTGYIDVPCFAGADQMHTLVINTSPAPAE